MLTGIFSFALRTSLVFLALADLRHRPGQGAHVAGLALLLLLPLLVERVGDLLGQGQVDVEAARAPRPALAQDLELADGLVLDLGALDEGRVLDDGRLDRLRARVVEEHLARLVELAVEAELQRGGRVRLDQGQDAQVRELRRREQGLALDLRRGHGHRDHAVADHVAAVRARDVLGVRQHHGDELLGLPLVQPPP